MVVRELVDFPTHYSSLVYLVLVFAGSGVDLSDIFPEVVSTGTWVKTTATFLRVTSFDWRELSLLEITVFIFAQGYSACSLENYISEFFGITLNFIVIQGAISDSFLNLNMLGQALKIKILAIQNLDVKPECLFLQLVQSLALYESGITFLFSVWIVILLSFVVHIYQVSNVLFLFVLNGFDKQSRIFSKFFFELSIDLLEII